MRFEQVIQDIGTLTEDDTPVTHRFIGVNVSMQPIRLARVSTTCSCLTASYQTGCILPGEKCEIALTYHPKNHPGTVDSNAFIYLADDESKPVARLTLTGNVLPGADAWNRFPYFMGKLRLKQDKMTIEMGAEETATERILCANSGEKPLRLSAQMLPAYATFRTEPEVIQPGSEADMVVTIRKSMLPENAPENLSFSIVIEGVNGRPSDRTLNITVNNVSSNHKNKN